MRAPAHECIYGVYGLQDTRVCTHGNVWCFYRALLIMQTSSSVQNFDELPWCKMGVALYAPNRECSTYVALLISWVRAYIFRNMRRGLSTDPSPRKKLRNHCGACVVEYVANQKLHWRWYDITPCTGK